MKTVLLIGTTHKYQRPLPEPYCHHSEQFRALLVATCQQQGVQAIAEEMSVEALRQHGVEQSICYQVAEALHITHQYCDPSTKERAALGVSAESELRNRIKELLAQYDTQRIAAEMRVFFAIRESYWLQHVMRLATWPVLFICGARHTETFQALLQDNNIIVHVLFPRWRPQ